MYDIVNRLIGACHIHTCTKASSIIIEGCHSISCVVEKVWEGRCTMSIATAEVKRYI